MRRSIMHWCYHWLMLCTHGLCIVNLSDAEIITDFLTTFTFGIRCVNLLTQSEVASSLFKNEKPKDISYLI